MIEIATYRITLSLIFVALIGCNDWKISFQQESPLPEAVRDLDNLTVHPADIEPAYEIAFERDTSFGSTPERFILVGVKTRADHKGRIFIPDRQQNVIHVFGPEGKYLARMGGEGKGPGEFIHIGSLKVGPEYLYIRDNELLKYNVFSLEELSFSHTMSLDPEDWNHIEELQSATQSGLYVRNDGMLLGAFSSVLPEYESKSDDANALRKRKYMYYWMDPDGAITSDKIVEREGSITVTENFNGIPLEIQLPVYPSSLITISDVGTIFTNRSDHFLIKVHDADGTYRRAFYYPYEKASLIRDSLIARYDQGFDSPQQQAVRHIDLPDTWPALASMRVDDNGRLWVATIVDNQSVYRWWILSQEGELLARFTWPRRNSIEDIRNNKMYSLERDEQGEARIVRYDIAME